MIYAYKARDPMGRIVRGELEAPTPERLKAELVGRALEVLWVAPTANSQVRAFTHGATHGTKFHEAQRKPFSSIEHGQKPATPASPSITVDADGIPTAENDSWEFEDGDADKRDADLKIDGKPVEQKKGCSFSFGLLFFILYVIYQIMKSFR